MILAYNPGFVYIGFISTPNSRRKIRNYQKSEDIKALSGTSISLQFAKNIRECGKLFYKVLEYLK